MKNFKILSIFSFFILFALAVNAQDPQSPPPGGDSGFPGDGGGMPPVDGGFEYGNPDGASNMFMGMGLTIDDFGANAAIFINDDKVIEDKSGEGTIEVAKGGKITSTEISGVKIEYPNVGDWSQSSAGQSGIIIKKDESGSAANDVVVIGGDEEIYKVDGEKYNTVVEMGMEDGQVDNALMDGVRNLANHDYENAPGLGIAFTANKVIMNNVYALNDGHNRAALRTRDETDVVIKNSTLTAKGGNGKEFTTPAFILLTGSARTALLESAGDTYIYDTKMYSSDWGTFSLDGAHMAHLYFVNCYSENWYGGYGFFSLGLGADDDNNFTEIYGCKVVSPQYGMLVCTAGDTKVDNIANASKEAMAEMSASEIGKPMYKGGDSFIGGTVCALLINSDMNAQKDRIGDLIVRNTTFSTVDLKNEKGKPIGDNLEMLEADYKNDAVKGGAPYIYMKYGHGAAVWLRSANTNLDFDGVKLESSSDLLFQSSLDFTNASYSYIKDGEVAEGMNLNLSNMDMEGDIVHDDYQRAMNIDMNNSSLAGAITSTTLAGWNKRITEYTDQNFDPNSDMDRAKILEALAPENEYKSFYGLSLNLNDGSSWVVTEESSLAHLTVASGASITAPKGCELTIYTDCPMGNDLEEFDTSKGKVVASLTPGKTYDGVVIKVSK